MWEPEAQGTVTKWNQVRPDWPNQDLRLFGPGASPAHLITSRTRSTAREKASRGDFTASEDDNVLVQGISNDPGALGYFGFAYYQENADKLKLVGIDAEKGGGCVDAVAGDDRQRHVRAALAPDLHLRQEDVA